MVAYLWITGQRWIQEHLETFQCKGKSIFQGVPRLLLENLVLYLPSPAINRDKGAPLQIPSLSQLVIQESVTFYIQHLYEFS